MIVARSIPKTKLDERRETMKNQCLKRAPISCAVLAMVLFAFVAQPAIGGVFTYITNTTPFQQNWNDPAYWTLNSGVDDGGNGFPDATDTFTMDRTGMPSSNTYSAKLAVEGGNSYPSSIAKITGIAGPGRDIVFKWKDFSIGDLELPSTTETFYIHNERDRNLTIDGIISGPGDLLITRSGGFTNNGVNPDELITFTGTAPNTITGEIHLYNDNASGDVVGPSGEPSYWVADKVGAFGLAPKITLEGRDDYWSNQEHNSGITSLQLTENTMLDGSEGAIDDDLTQLYIGTFGVLNVDADVNEVIGTGNLFIDLLGTGTYTMVPDGVYNSSADWITGAGSITVGPLPAVPEPSTFILGALSLFGLAMFRRRRNR